MGGLRVLVGATSVSQVGRGTGLVDGFGKVRTTADGFGRWIRVNLSRNQKCGHTLRIPNSNSHNCFSQQRLHRK